MSSASATFLCEILLLSVGLGLAGVASVRSLPLPRLGRFCFGIAATPFVAGAAILLATLIWPRLPQPVAAFVPAGLGAVLVFALRRQPVAQARWRRILRSPAAVVLLIGVAAVAILLATRLVFYAQQPFGNSDALQYLNEAKDFVRHRDFFDIAGMRGSADGVLRGDPHGALWIGYLASAMLWIGNGSVIADPVLLQLPFQISLIFYFCAVAAAASAFRRRYAVPAALLTAVAVPELFGVTFGGNRDAFRLAGLLLLVAFLLAHLRPGLRDSMRVPAALIAAGAGAAAVQGHALALMLTPATVAAWLLVIMLARQPSMRAMALTAAIAAGCLAGAWHVVQAYAETGSLLGDNVAAAELTKGTPYEHGVRVRDETRIGVGADPLLRFRDAVVRGHGWPSAVAVAVLLIAIVRLTWFRAGDAMQWRRRAAEWRVAFIAAWFGVNTLLLFGALDVGSLRLGAWSSLNPRYNMQWHLAAALIVAWCIAVALSRLSARDMDSRWALAPIAAGVLGAGTVLYVAQTWGLYSTPAYWRLREELNSRMRTLPSFCRVLAEDSGITFYAERPVVQIYSKPELDLLRARNASALAALLTERQFCAVVLYDGLYIDKAGPNTPFMQLLAGGLFERYDATPWRIYIRCRASPSDRPLGPACKP